jgi:hypothetical protein
MNLKQLSLASMLSLALATGTAGILGGSARAEAEAPSAPTIITPMDISLTASVRATLNNDQDLPLDNINVSSKDGFVELTGFVRSDWERSRAIQDAKSVPGVKTVDDNMTVTGSDD